MKKLLIILLALTCAFAMFSCAEKSDVSVKDFTAAADATSPKSVSVNVTAELPLGTLTASYNTEFAEDGSFTVAYSYDKFNSLGEGDSDSVTSTVSGTVSCDKNGTYSDAAIASKIPETAKAVKFNLDTKKMTAKISADGNVLTATVTADNTEYVLGYNYGADVTFVMAKAEGKIISLVLTYTSETTGTVTVICNYK